MLAELRTALLEGERRDLLALADPDEPEAGSELLDLARNVRTLRIDRLALRYLDQADRRLTADERELYGPEAWLAEVQLTWRFRGVDRRPSTLEVPLLADWDGDRAVFITSRAAEGYRAPLWFVERLAVRRTPDTLVLATGPQQARTLEREALIAVEVVRRTVPDWTEPLVVQAPATAAGFETAAGLSRQEARALAAVTTATDDASVPGSPVHIFLNPEVFGPLGPQGRQIVVSHEAAHVALDAATTALPLWLSEGMADYVALVDTTLPVPVLAAQALALVREEGPPRRLPGPQEFDGSNRDIGAWYEAAWLAVRLIGETYGEKPLLEFYALAEKDGDPARAFRRVLGTTEPEFVRAWRRSLVDLSG